MSRPVHPLRYRDEDRRLLTLGELSREARISRAFIHLCLENGCPSSHGLLSQAMLLDWLFEHSGAVRAAAGLKPYATLEGLGEPLQARLRMANAILTILEFSASRTSNPEEKEQLTWIHRTIEASLDRA